MAKLLIDPDTLIRVSTAAKIRRVSRTVIYKEISDKKVQAVLVDGTPHIINPQKP